MRASQIHRRLNALQERICPSGMRGFTLEELCRRYWKQNRQGFRALVSECGIYRVFLEMFEREEAESRSRDKDRKYETD
jgi:hypothetical protein